MKKKHRHEITLRQAGGFPRFLIPVIVILILGIAFVFSAKPLLNLDLGIRFLNTRVTSVSESVLVEVKDIFQFNTVEYVYKTVFPYDYVPSEYDWRDLVMRAGQNMPLDAEEEELLSMYRFCEKIGMKIDSRQFEFAVVTCIVKGGYELSGTLYDQIERDVPLPDIEGYISINEEEKSVTLRLPRPAILDVIIEDTTDSNYSYPALPISPENWKILTNFVAGKIREKVTADGILETAAEKGKEFITKVLKQSGFSSVQFIEPID